MRAIGAQPDRLRILGVLLLVLVSTGLASWSGLVAAIDGVVERSAYSLRGPRSSSYDVILVAIDEPTAAAWGPPPWPQHTWEQLAARAEQSGSRAVLPVAQVDRMFAGGTGAQPGSSPDLLSPEDEAAAFVRSVRLPDDATGTTAFLREATPEACRSAGSLTIDYVGTRDHLPTVSAHDLVAGRLPPQALADKIILVGVTLPSWAARFPTPVGWLTEPEILTHALATSIDGACVPRHSPILALVIVILAALLGLALGSRLPTAFGLATAALLVALGGVLYVAAFINHWFELAPTAPLLSLTLGLLFARAHERSAAGRELRQLARLAAGPARPELATPARSLGQTLSDATDLFLDGVHSSFLGTFDGIDAPIVLSVIHGAQLDEVMEPGRDARKEPFREAAVTRQLAWTTGFMRDPELRTLIVPLEGTRGIVGLWLINYASDSFSDPLQRPLVEQLARQLAATLTDTGPAPRRGRALPVLRRDVAAVDAALRERLARTEQVADVATHLPAIVIMASVWGEITWMNGSAARLCAQEGNTAEQRLDVVLGSVMSISPVKIRRVLRRTLALGLDGRMTGTVQTRTDARTSYDILVSLTNLGSASSRSLLVVALETPAFTSRIERPSGLLPAARFDVRGVLLGALGDARARTPASSPRPVCLDFDDPMPQASGDLGLFQDAIASLLADLLSTGDESTPVLVTANPTEDRLVIRFADSTIPLPKASLEALLLDRGGQDPGMGGLAHAVELLRTQGVTVEVEGAAGSGATIQLMIPRAREQGAR